MNIPEPPATTFHQLTLLRLIAQGIAGPGFDSPAEAVAALTAIQGQDHPGAITSIALRTRSRSRAAVDEALNQGTVVKSWPMRGTLHFVPAEDLQWMLELTAARIVAGSGRRHAELELDEAQLEHARELAVRTLTGGRSLGRAELLQYWQQSGVNIDGQRGAHLILHLAQTGTLCFGLLREGVHQLVLLSEWVPKPRRLDREHALAELARRYFRAHGPASAKDFGRWGKLVAADVRAGVAAARPHLERLELDGVEYLMDPLTPERLARHRAQARGVFLLPGFDEYLLGYGDREAMLPREFADRIVPGGNGMFRATVVADGQVVGTWNRIRRGAVREISADPFTRFSPAVEKAIPQLYAALP